MTLREILKSDILVGLYNFLLDFDLIITFYLIVYFLMLWLFFKFGALMISKISDISEKYSEIKKINKRLLTKNEVFMRRVKSVMYLLIGLFFFYLFWVVLKDLGRFILMLFNEFTATQPLAPEVDNKSLY
tara:strand:+ start:223 stop:612 length:390 start_codon:yes stop_codon:yes gene_type:complete